MARRKAMKEERLQSAADREEPSGPFSPCSTGPVKLKNEIWAISSKKNHTVSTPRSKSSKRLHISLGVEKLRAQAFVLCTQALCTKCIGSPTILTWFIISIPCIRLRDFLSSCLKIFMSESICFTRSWNSLVSLPCCTLRDQKWGGGQKKKEWDSHLAPSLTEEAVASADGNIAAAVAANRVRSLKKNTAPEMDFWYEEELISWIVPATAASDPEKSRTSPRTEPPLSPAFLYSSSVSSERMKLLMKSSSSETSNSDLTISWASST